MSGPDVVDVSVIGIRADKLRDLEPDRIEVQLNLGLSPVDGHPDLFTTTLTLDVSATERGESQDEAEPWTTVAVRCAVTLSEAQPQPLEEGAFERIYRQSWPYLRARAIPLLAEMGLNAVPVPLDPASIEGVVIEAPEGAR